MGSRTKRTCSHSATLVVAFLLTIGLLVSTTMSASALSSSIQKAEKTIVVNLSKQWLYAYENGKEVYDAPVTTGRPELPTPTGTYSIYSKESPTTFRSPWPEGSPYWYPPVPISYAMQWLGGGYFLHDATWRSVFGPGTNTWHDDAQFGAQTGSHGCISMPLHAAAWVYKWAPVGTTIQIHS